MLKSSRRGFLLGLLAMPAVVHAGNLMPISARNLQKGVLWRPCYELVVVDMYGNKGREYVPIPGGYAYTAKEINEICGIRLAELVATPGVVFLSEDALQGKASIRTTSHIEPSVAYSL